MMSPPGSLGGARPKASFRADDGMLWIGKFPAHNDRWDIGRWELVMNRLAQSSGISVPPCEVLKLSNETTFTAQRFDRTQPGRRRLFASAMTLAGKRDHDPASYIDIAEAIVQYGDPKANKLEHALALDDANHAPDLDVVRQTSAYYRVKPGPPRRSHKRCSRSSRNGERWPRSANATTMRST
jgi:hypothetical protein